MEFLKIVTGIPQLMEDPMRIIMVGLSFLLAYLGIVKKYEPLLLIPISFGVLMANLAPGLLAYNGTGVVSHLYQGIKLEIFPPMIFLCLGAMTDFGPLIASPRSVFIGIGGQLGIFTALILALIISYVVGGPESGSSLYFSLNEALAIGIIGSSDGPTTIYIVNKLAPHMLATISIAAYSYMALVPIIQPPIMKLLTTPEERVIVMPKPENVTQRQKILFPIFMTIGTLVLVPAAGPLISMLMMGNLIRECGVTERISKMLQGDVLSLLTMLIALCIGSSATADNILHPKTLVIIVLGLIAFAFGTAGGVLMAKFLNKATGGKVNPLIGNAGVSAMPMAARVSQKMAQQYNPNNYVLMHAMGPIVASTLGSALLAGIFITIYPKLIEFEWIAHYFRPIVGVP